MASNRPRSPVPRVAAQSAPRTAVVWFPDWPVIAAASEAGVAADAADSPVAVVESGRIHACSPAARDAGVRRGLRVREAQSRCPGLLVLRYDPAIDARAFDPVVAVVEDLTPGVEIVRPGMCALAVRGPARYFGGEDAFAQRLLDHLDVAGHSAVIGIADGVFAAEQAARRHTAVPPGGSAEFLAPLPIDTLGRPELADLLRRLGIRTLGAYAALPPGRVLERFGVDGLLAHRLAAGREERPAAARRPPPDSTTEAVFDAPLDRVDQVAFAMRGAADRLVTGLAERELVCTCLRVEAYDQDGAESSREWRHPRWFTATDVVDRVRWQLSITDRVGRRGGEPSRSIRSGLIRVRLVPEEVGRTGSFAAGLWGDTTPDDGVHRALTRVQSLLGHAGVVTARPTGGRALADRVVHLPWGDLVAEIDGSSRPGGGRSGKDRSGPPTWPGVLPAPAPATVLPEPATLASIAELGEPVAWAGPWPVDERWWDPVKARRYDRYQVVLADGSAHVIGYERGRGAENGEPGEGRWFVEAHYD